MQFKEAKKEKEKGMKKKLKKIDLTHTLNMMMDETWRRSTGEGIKFKINVPFPLHWLHLTVTR